jgi:hypothetical protein
MADRWKFTTGSFLDGLEFDDRQDFGDANTLLKRLESKPTDCTTAI